MNNYEQVEAFESGVIFYFENAGVPWLRTDTGVLDLFQYPNTPFRERPIPPIWKTCHYDITVIWVPSASEDMK